MNIIEGLLYAESFYLSPYEIDYTRRISSIFDVFGYIGGIFGVLSPFAAMIVGPIAEFNFYFKLL